MARTDLMSKTLISEASLQSYMLSGWAASESLLSVGTQAEEFREINPFLP